MDKYEFGRLGEQAAAAYMENLGFTVTGRNVRVGHSEFDIICKDEKYLLFVEVKTRNMYPGQRSRYGPPRCAVGRDKQEYLLRGMLQYLRENNLRGKLLARIDVMEVYASASPMFIVHDIKHYKNAVRMRSSCDGYY